MDILHIRPTKMQRSKKIYLTFTNDDLGEVEFPHNDPLVITTLIANHNVHRILMDIGATSYIMCACALKSLGFSTV